MKFTQKKCRMRLPNTKSANALLRSISRASAVRKSGSRTAHLKSPGTRSCYPDSSAFEVTLGSISVLSPHAMSVRRLTDL